MGWGALPALLMLLGLARLPESPRWLAHARGDEAAARVALRWLRGCPSAAEAELQEIMSALEAERAIADERQQTLLQRLWSRRVWNALKLGPPTAATMYVDKIGPSYADK